MPISSNSKTKTLLALIFLLAILARVAVALYMGNQVVELPGIADQKSYHTLAIRLITGHGFTFDRFWWPLTKPDHATAHWSYLYTLFIAAIYQVFTIQPLLARLIQAIFAGLVMPWLVFRVATRTFMPIGESSNNQNLAKTVGLVAAGWTAVYGYFVYYAGALMTETFYMLAILWSLDYALRIAQKTDGRKWFLWLELGLALGAAVLIRQVYLVFIPILCVWLLWQIRTSAQHKNEKARWRNWIVGLGISVVVLGMMIAPFTLLNYRNFNRFVLLNTNAGYAFYWANHPVHGDKFIPLLTGDMPSYVDIIPPELRKLDEADLEQALMSRGIQFIKDDPLRFIRLSISRIPVYFQFWPTSDSGALSNITRVVSFGIAWPFMLLGIILWLKHMVEAAKRVQKKSELIGPGLLLIAFIVVYSAVHLVSWASVRYRLPVDAVGLIFAAYAMTNVISRATKFLNRPAQTLPHDH